MRAVIEWFRMWLAGLDAVLDDGHVHVVALRNAAVRAWNVPERDVFVIVAFDERECIVRHVDGDLAVETRGTGAYSAALGALISWDGLILTGNGGGVVGVARRADGGAS